MPKGRGANERRRSYRQKHPKDMSLNVGAVMLLALYDPEQIKKRRKERKKNGPTRHTTG